MSTDPTTPWDRTAERGSYALLSALLIASLVGLSAFSVDVSLITMSELQAQATADAASHAALIGFRRSNGNQTAGRTAAQWIVDRNKVGLGTARLDNVTFGRWDYTANAFMVANTQINSARATVSRKAADGNAVQLLLAPMLGVNTVNVDAEGITAEQLRAVMLVMDMSCSMMNGNKNDPNSPVNVGRSANIGFLDYLLQNPVEGDLLGLSMFGDVANKTPTTGQPLGAPVTPGTRIPTLAGDPPWLPLTYLETQSALVRQRINGICDTMIASNNLCVAGAPHPTTSSIGSCTNPGPAMYQAANELANPNAVGATYFKAMVVFSDGQPNCGMGAAGGTNAANFAWARDIYIWTILYGWGGSVSPAYMQSLVRGAPTAFAQSGNLAQLGAMYQTVAKSLPTALVY
jgi:hypothetical protein